MRPITTGQARLDPGITGRFSAPAQATDWFAPSARAVRDRPLLGRRSRPFGVNRLGVERRSKSSTDSRLPVRRHAPPAARRRGVRRAHLANVRLRIWPIVGIATAIGIAAIGKRIAAIGRRIATIGIAAAEEIRAPCSPSRHACKAQRRQWVPDVTPEPVSLSSARGP